jgi:hypothetical protein
LPSENSPNPAVPAATASATSNTIPPPRKKARMTGRSNKPSRTLSPLRQSRNSESSKTGNQAANVMPSHASHLAEHCSHACPESGVDFTPPSWRGLSLWMGSVMGWSH